MTGDDGNGVLQSTINNTRKYPVRKMFVHKIVRTVVVYYLCVF